MKRGLVIGKFMPLHKGHCALVRFAAAQCDELIVSMTYRDADPIPGPLRFGWIKEEFRDMPSVFPEISIDDFDDESLQLAERMPLWAAFLNKRFPRVDVVISSEPYGTLLAERIGAAHISFDPSRTVVPVSGTKIRSHPFRYWDFIAEAARSYFVKRICFYGPESTGKSTAAVIFAERYNTESVPEVSRELISTNDFTIEDIIRIGHAQTDRVAQKSRVANKLLFCDTDVITTQIYCRHYLQKIPDILFDLERMTSYEKYFLFEPDVPWVADGLRDLGGQRNEMFQTFRQELDVRGIDYTLVHGDWKTRQAIIDQYVEGLIKTLS